MATHNIFEEDDRVKCIGAGTPGLRGAKGTVEQVGATTVFVRWDDARLGSGGIHFSRLERIEREPKSASQRSPADDLTIRQLQTNLPWSIRYSTDFRSSPITHKDFAHALTHVGKAAGFLHALVDDMDHDRSVADDSAAVRDRAEKYIADLVICAMRMANTLPGGVLDLQRAVQHRIESKNGVKLPTGD